MTKIDLLQGTLDLMVLQTLSAMGSMHGYGLARRIEQVSGNEVPVSYTHLDVYKRQQERIIAIELTAS